MPVDEGGGRVFRDDVPFERALVDLRESVVQALAVAERLVDRGVESVKETQLELVWALE
jgi:hypothetical protein